MNTTGASRGRRLSGAPILCLLASSVLAHADDFIREVISREVSVLAVSSTNPIPVVKEVFSREVSVFASSDPILHFNEVISREVSVVNQTTAVPAPVANLSVSTTPTGDSATLNWSSYNEVAEHDVARYDVYISGHAFTNVASMSPYTNVTASVFLVVLGGLPPWQDRYFAVVAVDTLGGFADAVQSTAKYVLAREVISREISVLAVSSTSTTSYAREVISREVSVVNADTAMPTRITGLSVSTTPTGDEATLNWSSYNEVAEHDVARYDIYVSEQAFSDVFGMTPHTNATAGRFSIMLTSLTPWRDRYFAVVPVDVLGGFDLAVNAASAYVLAREVVSREVSVLAVSSTSTTSCVQEVISREVSVLVPSSDIPEPVTYRGSSFSAQPSVSGYCAIDLNWSDYNEVAQHDVVRYRIYVEPYFFMSVADKQPFAFTPAGRLACTVSGLGERADYAVAVVAEDALGQWNPNVWSVYTTSSSAQTFSVGVKVWLQGAYSSNAMRTALNADLPLTSPFVDDLLHVSSIAQNVTDWVLGALVDTNGQQVLAQSLWLRSDGIAVSPGHTQTVWKVDAGAELGVVLKHRNHVAVMSSSPLSFTTGELLQSDFTTGPDKYMGGTNACVELEPGVWGMIAGDCDGDGKVTDVDRAIVSNQLGKIGYLVGDLNLDGVVTEEDLP